MLRRLLPPTEAETGHLAGEATLQGLEAEAKSDLGSCCILPGPEGLFLSCANPKMVQEGQRDMICALAQAFNGNV